jgi:hypothetical protein
MSLKVFRPIKWAPACQTLSTVQALPSSLVVLKFQSISPFGPPTKPSRVIDIFRTNFLIIVSPGAHRLIPVRAYRYPVSPVKHVAGEQVPWRRQCRTTERKASEAVRELTNDTNVAPPLGGERWLYRRPVAKVPVFPSSPWMDQRQSWTRERNTSTSLGRAMGCRSSSAGSRLRRKRRPVPFCMSMARHFHPRSQSLIGLADDRGEMPSAQRDLTFGGSISTDSVIPPGIRK